MTEHTSDRGFGRYLTDEHRDRRAVIEAKVGDIVDGVTVVENPDYIEPAKRPPRTGARDTPRDRGFGRYLPDDSSTDR